MKTKNSMKWRAAFSNSFESVQLLLSCLVAVFCLAEVSLFCFDRSVVTLLRRASITTVPSLRFSTQCFPFTLASYCEYRISSFSTKPVNTQRPSEEFHLVEAGKVITRARHGYVFYNIQLSSLCNLARLMSFLQQAQGLVEPSAEHRLTGHV